MNLGEHYSKSVIKKFDLLPVYPPDIKIKPGAILNFGINILGSASKPFGSFQVVDNLIDGQKYKFPLKVNEYSSKTIYNFVTENEVKVSAAIEGEVPNVASGDIKFSFGKKGSILLYGVHPTESRLESQLILKECLDKVKESEDWNNYYIVTSVFTCKKALIYQSNESDGSLVVSASAKNIKVNNSELANVDLGASFDVKWKSKQAFIVEWSEDVVLFMNLAKYNKKTLKIYEKSKVGGSATGGQTIKNDIEGVEGSYELEEIFPSDLLQEEIFSDKKLK